MWQKHKESLAIERLNLPFFFVKRYPRRLVILGSFLIIVPFDKLVFFSELPETSFTRSISNPEAVMRRRRQQKLERKLQQFRSKDGGPDTGM